MRMIGIFAGDSRLHRVVPSDVLTIRPNDWVQKWSHPFLMPPFGEDLTVDLHLQTVGTLDDRDLGREPRRTRQETDDGGHGNDSHGTILLGVSKTSSPKSLRSSRTFVLVLADQSERSTRSAAATRV